MKWIKRCQRVYVATLAMALPGLAGCIEYTIETTMNADGSGVRHEEMIVDQDEDAGIDVSRADFGALMFVTEKYRWTYREDVEDDDKIHEFQRETRIRDLASWTDVSDDVHIAGATGASAGSNIGHISLGDVHFRNSVRVETGRVAEGTTFTYRETFYWENLVDALIEYFVQSFVQAIDAQYPDLTSEQRSELVGFVRGGLWSAVELGLLDAGDDEEEVLVSAFSRRTGIQAARIVRQRYPDADEEFFENLLRELYEDEDDRLDDFIVRKLPGVQLAINCAIVFRLNMPGRVTSSNAHDRDGDTLIWEFGPADAATAPLEIIAESIVER